MPDAFRRPVGWPPPAVEFFSLCFKPVFKATNEQTVAISGSHYSSADRTHLDAMQGGTALITTRVSLAIVVSLLSLAVASDIACIAIGGPFTADTYYLPLRDFDLGESRTAIETAIIKTHTAAMTRKHGILLVVHALALAAAVIACKSVSPPRRTE